jgi:hypothetical protein
MVGVRWLLVAMELRVVGAMVLVVLEVVGHLVVEGVTMVWCRRHRRHRRRRNQWWNRQSRRRGLRRGWCVVFGCGRSRGCVWVGQAGLPVV